MAETNSRPTGLPPRRPTPAPDTRKHVIAEYRHKAAEVDCLCGWTGSTASPDGKTSDWTRHLAASRQAG